MPAGRSRAARRAGQAERPSGASVAVRLRRLGCDLSTPARLPVCFGVLVTIFALCVLFVPRPVGMADNGDELRLVCRMGLAPEYVPEQKIFFETVNFTYRPGKLPIGLNCDYHSTAQFPLQAASLVSRILPGGHSLDLRVVGVFYALAFGAAVSLVVAGLPKRRGARVLGGTLAVALLGDIAFVGYFSTGYSEPMGIVGLVAAVGALLVGWRRPERPRLGWLLFCTALVLATVGAKPQYGLLAPIFAVALAVRPVRDVPRWGHRAFPVVCACAVLVIGAIGVALNPPQFNRINRYNAFFGELLPHSDNPARTVREFGLPPAIVHRSGLLYFSDPDSEDTPAMDLFYRRVHADDFLRYYARHPGQTTSLVARGLRAGADPRLDYVGRYPYSVSGRKRSLPCQWCLPSATGRLVRPATPVLAPLLWLGGLLLGVAEVRSRDRERAALGGGLLVTASVGLVIFVSAVFGEGTELTKHLVIGVLSGWLGLVLAAVAVAGRLTARRSTRRAATPWDPQAGLPAT